MKEKVERILESLSSEMEKQTEEDGIEVVLMNPHTCREIQLYFPHIFDPTTNVGRPEMGHIWGLPVLKESLDNYQVQLAHKGIASVGESKYFPQLQLNLMVTELPM